MDSGENLRRSWIGGNASPRYLLSGADAVAAGGRTWRHGPCCEDQRTRMGAVHVTATIGLVGVLLSGHGGIAVSFRLSLGLGLKQLVNHG